MDIVFKSGNNTKLMKRKAYLGKMDMKIEYKPELGRGTCPYVVLQIFIPYVIDNTIHEYNSLNLLANTSCL